MTKSPLYICRKYTLNLSDKTLIMGILNVTPDSFSDGGKFLSKDSAVKQALRMATEGADIIDVGGESTRPGAPAISAKEELKRVIPVIRALAGKVKLPVSIDTYKSEVAEAALSEGASIVNDISGFRFDKKIAGVAARYKAGVVLMHILGVPGNMQQNPGYENLIKEISLYLKKSALIARRAGVAKESIILDPGIGFGKTLEHNLLLIKKIGEFRKLGYPVLMGPSRKSFIGKLLGLPAEERLEGTLAAVAACVLNGASAVRVHDVKETARVVKIAGAIKKA
ncbi:MAG: dihydropteroate synthase [Candidatus Firestonebacteria bacterium]